jgi:uncharacterized protein (DUF2384 family)
MVAKNLAAAGKKTSRASKGYSAAISGKNVDARFEAEPKKAAPRFRPGKVPDSLVRKMHGAEAEQGTLQSAVQEGVRQIQAAAAGAAAAGAVGLHAPWGLVAGFMNASGLVDIGRVAELFRMSKGQLAETAGLGRASITKASRRGAPKTQARVTEMLEIINRVKDWAGGEAQAMAWYRSQPLPALDGRTPEALVKSGRAAAVRDYLDHFALGGYA